MSHSYGATVVADIFQRPAYDAWRLENVKGWIPIGPTFGGAAATPWLTMLSGDFFKLLPVASNLLKPATTGRWKPTVIGRSVYNFAFGMPTWGWLLPRDGVLGVNSVGMRLAGAANPLHGHPHHLCARPGKGSLLSAPSMACGVLPAA